MVLRSSYRSRFFVRQFSFFVLRSLFFVRERVRAVSSRQIDKARVGAGRWERRLPRPARQVSQSPDRLTTADGSNLKPGDGE